MLSITGAILFYFVSGLIAVIFCCVMIELHFIVFHGDRSVNDNKSVGQ